MTKMQKFLIWFTGWMFYASAVLGIQAIWIPGPHTVKLMLTTICLLVVAVSFLLMAIYGEEE